MDASQYKDYILTLLFVKYVTDKFKGLKYADIAVPDGGSFDDLVKLKGNKNIGEEMDKDNSVTVNMEQIYAWNPSLIFITNFTTADADALYNNTVGTYNWSVVNAVENQRVYKMPLGMYRSYTPGVDTPVTLLWLAKTAYPALFEDIDIIQEAKNYYQEVFGITLTDEQAASIFTPTAQAGSGF